MSNKSLCGLEPLTRRRLVPLAWMPAFAGMTETGRHSRAGGNPEKPGYTPRTGFCFVRCS